MVICHFSIPVLGRHEHFPDAGERHAAPAAVPAPESWQFRDFRTEGFHTRDRRLSVIPQALFREIRVLHPVYSRKPGNCLFTSAVIPAGAARLSPAFSGSIRISFLASRTYSDRQENCVRDDIRGNFRKNMCTPACHVWSNAVGTSAFLLYSAGNSRLPFSGTWEIYSRPLADSVFENGR